MGIAGYIGIGLVILFIGVTSGYLLGCFDHRCTHDWKKIIDDDHSMTPGVSHVVVHMCKNCGKIKITKV